MYNTIKNVIERKDFNLGSIMKKIDEFWLNDKITSSQREELVAMARENAKDTNSIDVFEKLIEFEARISAIEEKVSDNVQDDTVEEYKQGTWYRTGDKVAMNGEIYECIAPEGVVCVWSPEEYPQYWSKV